MKKRRKLKTKKMKKIRLKVIHLSKLMLKEKIAFMKKIKNYSNNIKFFNFSTKLLKRRCVKMRMELAIYWKIHKNYPSNC